jgi:hypothetical protein
MCDLDPLTGSYRCTLCQSNLVLTESGLCACPVGQYGTNSSSEPVCTDCPKGSYCPGGTYTAPGTPEKLACGANLTTAGKRASKLAACGKP